MGKRVLLLILGLIIALVLQSYFGLSRRMALVVGLLPFGLMEAKGVLSPYEPSASDLLHAPPDAKDDTTSTKA